MDAIALDYGSSSSSEAENDHESEKGNTAPSSNGSGSDSAVDNGDCGSRKRKRTDSERPRWKRMFGHVDGNWPSHVRIDVQMSPDLSAAMDQVISSAQSFVGADGVELVPMADAIDEECTSSGLHLSLSRPFVLTYDQIDAFVETLRSALKWRTRFTVTLDEAIVLVNDERTRSFLALCVGAGATDTLKLINCVDKCMREFGLPSYFKDPIPHVSVASAPGDSLIPALSVEQMRLLHPGRDTCEVPPSTSTTFPVTAVHVAIGNKEFRIPLR